MVRARSLVSNSVSSLISSGLLIFNTLLVPALLVRTITRPDYDLLMSTLAVLMLLSVVASSTRGIAPSQLVLAYAQTSKELATATYARFTLWVIAGTAALAVFGSEIFLGLQTSQGDLSQFRFGMYCIVVHALGLIAMGIFAGPAAAQRDFLPDNFAKLWPGIYHLIGIGAVWLIHPPTPLFWIFLVYLSSSWVGSLILGIWLWVPLFGKTLEDDEPTRQLLARTFWSGLRGLAWWNLMSYLAVNAATFLVLVLHPREIVPFGIAVSLLGVTSAGLIAVASPITGYAASLHDHPVDERRRFFLVVNTLFQLYVVATSVVILLLPQWLFEQWLTAELATQVQHFCLLLLPAYFLRQLTISFSIAVMSVGRQEHVWLTPLLEAILAVGGGVVLGLLFGIEGVPLALTLSSLVRLLMTAWHDEPRNAADIGIRRGDILWSSLTLLKLRH